MNPHDKPRRLDQILSNYGYCSRSQARHWVLQGHVTVNGEPARAADDKALVGTVRVDGEPIEFPDGIIALLHKPAGCICTHEEREGPSVYELLPPRWVKRNPPVTTIGRLDKDTTGVLLVTDHGDLVQRLTSPRHKVEKTYEVMVDHDLDPSLIGRFAKGDLMLEGEFKPCLPARLEILGPREARLHLIEGRYHQVKRMFESQGWIVTKLHRSSFGSLKLGELQPGQWRMLSTEEIPSPTPTVD